MSEMTIKAGDVLTVRTAAAAECPVCRDVGAELQRGPRLIVTQAGNINLPETVAKLVEQLAAAQEECEATRAAKAAGAYIRCVADDECVMALRREQEAIAAHDAAKEKA